MIEIPGYTILRPLGQGGMATVYLAMQQSLGREVALKILAPSLALDSSATERFLREAHIAAKLQHPHIVAIHDVGNHVGRPYIAMAFEPGGSIADQASLPCTPTDALGILRDMAGALAYAHAHGVVHRDVKPGNILRRSDGSAVLADFGIARALENDPGLTGASSIIGTPHYMSPEQGRGEAVDGRADLYSLGIVMFQLLTGNLPYQGSNGFAIGVQHISAPIPRLPVALAWLQALLDDLLAKDPAARIQSGAELLRRIDALRSGLLPAITTEAPITAPQSSPQAQPPWFRRRRQGLVWAGLGLFAALVLGWWQPWQQARPAIVAGVADASLDRSIAVLPFVDMSQAKDQEYFSDGLSEELLDRLAKLPQLKVAGRTSSFSFKGRNDDLKMIGAKLGVAHVLEGSVRKSGNRLRITAQLIKVSDGFHQWSETYDRQLTDVFAVQDEIAAAVVAALQIKLLPEQQAGRRQHYVPSPAGYDQFLLGRSFLSSNQNGNYQRAMAALRQAVQLDPDYALAYATLGMAEAFEVESAPDPSQKKAGQERALAAAERAIALDPDLGDGYGTRGFLRQSIDWDWNGALADLERAQRLDPTHAPNPLRYGYLLATLGRLPEAISALRSATQADPLFGPAWVQLGRLYMAISDYPSARHALSQARVVAPDDFYVIGMLNQLALLEGDAAAALNAWAKEPTPRFRLLGTVLAQHDLGHPELAQVALRQLIDQYGVHASYQIAQAQAYIGNADAAFEWLQRALERRDSGLLSVQFDPLLSKIRSDPRYRALLLRMGF